MFLIRLPPSMRETVGAVNHKTAAAMVMAANALWDARRGHNPTDTGSRSLAPERKKNDKRGGGAHLKSRPPSSQDFLFNPPHNNKCKYHSFYCTRANRCVPPCAWFENWKAAEPVYVLYVLYYTPELWWGSQGFRYFITYMIAGWYPPPTPFAHNRNKCSYWDSSSILKRNKMNLLSK